MGDNVDAYLLVAALAVGIMALLAVRFIFLRSPGTSVTPSGPGSGFPRRLHLAALFLFFATVAVYGSLIPWRTADYTLAEGIELFKEIPWLHLDVEARSDWVANLLIMIPVSFFLVGACTLDRDRASVAVASSLAAVLFCSLLAVAIEFTQIWFPRRTVSQNDVVAESLGGIAGVSLWWLVGRPLLPWLRGLTAAETARSRRVEGLLEAYLLGLLAYTLFPLDLTISVTEIFQKMEKGRIILVPFSDVGFDLGSLYSVTRDTLVFVPVGMLVAVWRSSGPPRSILVSALWTLVIAALLEACQLLVFSRHTATTDIILAGVGGLIGAGLTRSFRPHADSGALPESRRASPRAGGKALAALLTGVVYAGGLMAFFWAPYELQDDRRELRKRYEGYWEVPFQRMYRRSEFQAGSDALRKVLLFAPLGALAALTSSLVPAPVAVRRAVLIALLLATGVLAVGVELGQAAFPPHVPDCTDSILYFAGALGGAALLAWARRGAPVGANRDDRSVERTSA